VWHGVVWATCDADVFLLEELVAGELSKHHRQFVPVGIGRQRSPSYLRTTLDQITHSGWSESCKKSRSTLLGYNRAPSADHVIALQSIVDLDARLDDVDWSSSLQQAFMSVEPSQLLCNIDDLPHVCLWPQARLHRRT
jgi:hypothetical protein